MINTTVDPLSKKYQCYFLLRKIINICSTDEIYKEDLPRFKSLCSKFIDLYIEAFPDLTVIFKIHYLEHYEECINEFSLLMLSSTLVYERVNQKAIRSVEGSRNYIDLALQIFNNFTFKVDDYFKLDVQQTFNSLQGVEPTLASYFDNSRGIQITDVKDCKMIIIDNMKVKLFNYYLYNYKHPTTGLPLFLYVTKIYYVNNRIPVIIGRVFAANAYSRDYAAYMVQMTHDVIAINLKQILHHKKATVFTNNNNFYINDTFYIRQDFQYLDSIQTVEQRV